MDSIVGGRGQRKDVENDKRDSVVLIENQHYSIKMGVIVCIAQFDTSRDVLIQINFVCSTTGYI